MALSLDVQGNNGNSSVVDLSLAEIGKYNASSDCWIIVDDKVYDVSEYLKFYLHPGENDAITPYCGKEATNAFQTQDRMRKPKDHSGYAWTMLDDYYVGDLAKCLKYFSWLAIWLVRR